MTSSAPEPSAAAPIRALLLCQSLEIAGGVERFACGLANHLAAQGIDCVLGSVDTPRARVAYALDPAVRVLMALPASPSPSVASDPASAANAPFAAPGAPSLRSPSGLFRRWALLRNQWRTGRGLGRLIRAERPDVVLLNGLTTACSVLLLCPSCARRAICCDHNHYAARSRPWQWLRARLYPKVAALVSLTEADAPKFRALNPRTEMIANASAVRAAAPPVEPANEPALVLAIGRFVAQKGFDLLLLAWQRVAGEAPSARLRIVGDGPLHGALVAQAQRLGVADRIEWAAPTRAIEPHYRSAAVFVLPSRYEGQPLVLLEAQAMGLPVVAFDCPTGPAEIVAPGTGLLVPAGDVAALAEALLTLLAEPALRRRMAAAAWQRSRDAFSPETHFERWTALVRAVARRDRGQHAA